MAPQITLVYNKSNTYGLQQDAKVLDSFLGRGLATKIRHADPLEPPVLSDLTLHLEVPSYVWMPWSRLNAIVINPEWWEDAWNPYLRRFDALFFKCNADRQAFLKDRTTWIPESLKTFVLPWTTLLKPKLQTAKPHALWLLGASQNKRQAAVKILPLWKESWPPLHVYTTTPLTLSSPPASNVTINVEDVSEEERVALQGKAAFALIFSQAEALGMAAMESLAAGAFLIGNGLPTYQEAFEGNPHVVLTTATLKPLKAGVHDTFESSTFEQELEDALKVAETTWKEEKGWREAQQGRALKRREAFENSLVAAVQELVTGDEFLMAKKSLRTLPPVVGDADLPKISVVTLLYNRRSFVDLAMHNLLITDYPKDKIEWVVIEDSDNTDEQASDKIIRFGREAAPMSVSYIPLQKKTAIGKKRNLAIEKAQHDIIVMMDDDDHYPPSSFRRRVSWLIRHPWQPKATVATTIACYDLMQGTSAVNTPPWSLGLKDRVSEATLCFYKSWWEAGKFADTANMSEGEGLVAGRELDVLELAPQQLIVAMSHGKNSSSRRIPPGPSGKPSCFWGFPKEFLLFLHKLAGVSVEALSS